MALKPWIIKAFVKSQYFLFSIIAGRQRKAVGILYYTEKILKSKQTKFYYTAVHLLESAGHI